MFDLRSAGVPPPVSCLTGRVTLAHGLSQHSDEVVRAHCLFQSMFTGLPSVLLDCDWHGGIGVAKQVLGEVFEEEFQEILSWLKY